MKESQQEHVNQLKNDWSSNRRWASIKRPYSAEEVVKLRPSIKIEYSLAKHGAERLWNSLQDNKPVTALGCLTGNQAVQAIQAGLQAIYCSGWQVAGDNNSAGQMYPDQSLYPVDSVPNLVESINNALQRTDEIHGLDNARDIDWFAPIIADAE